MRILLIATCLLPAVAGCSSSDGPPAANSADNRQSPSEPASPTPQSKSADKASDNSTAIPYTISKQTTFIDGPLTADGRPDFAAAINQHASRGVTPANNAAVPLFQAFGPAAIEEPYREEFFRAIGIPLQTNGQTEGSRFLSIYDFLQKTAPNLSEDERFSIADQQTAAVAAPWKRSQFPQIAAWLDYNEAALKLAGEAVRRKRYFSPFVGSKLLDPGQRNIRSVARALVARAMLSAGESEPAGEFSATPWQDLLTTMKLSRLVGKGPIQINNLVAIALDGVARKAALRLVFSNASLTAEQLRNRISQINALPPMPPFADNLEFGERLYFLALVLQLTEGEPDKPRQGDNLAMLLGALGRRDENVWKTVVELARTTKGDWDPALKQVNADLAELSKTFQAADRRTAKQQFKAYLQRRSQLALGIQSQNDLTRYLENAKNKSSAVPELIASGLQHFAGMANLAALDAEARGRQADRLARTALLIRLFQLENGSFPRQLEQLVPKYLPVIPVDEFAGQPIRYRTTENGFVLYSVGPNGKDERGNTRADPPNHEGDDLRIRVPIDKDGIIP